MIVFYLTGSAGAWSSVLWTRPGRARADTKRLVGGQKVPVGRAACDWFDYDCGVTGTKRPQAWASVPAW